jgi:hypothetical protein
MFRTKVVEKPGTQILFFILLTVHLDLIMVNDQLDALDTRAGQERHVKESPTRLRYTR